MNKHTIYALAIGALLPLHSLAANVDVAVIPASNILAPGDRTFVDLVGTYDGSDRVLGGAISLSFRADLLEVLGVTLNAPKEIGGTTGSVVVNGSSGMVSGIGFATFAGVTGVFALATVEFRALGSSGASPLVAFDANDPIYAWVNEAFDTVTVTSSPSMITVTAVPEPAALAMLLAGLGVVASLARRKLR